MILSADILNTKEQNGGERMNPYDYSYQQQSLVMQQRLNELQRQQQAYINSSQGYPANNYFSPSQNWAAPILNGRIVTSIEEAKAAQIPLDGTSSFFFVPE